MTKLFVGSKSYAATFKPFKNNWKNNLLLLRFMSADKMVEY